MEHKKLDPSVETDAFFSSFGKTAKVEAKNVAATGAKLIVLAATMNLVLILGTVAGVLGLLRYFGVI